MTTQHIMSVPPHLRVVITGGASGIGLKIAECFHQHNAKVTICGSNNDKLQACLKNNPTWFGKACDVRQSQQVDEFITFAHDKMGGIDILINNAGIAGPTTTVDACSPEEWRNTMDVNINGVFYGIRAAVNALKISKGSIITISSVAGRIGFPLRSPYCTSKFALQGLTEALAKELGPFGIRVNSILPGFVESERWTNTTKARAQEVGITYQEMRERLLAKSSLKSTVSEEEVAQLCLYLSSPLGRHITGQSLSICAGVEYL